MSADDPAAKRPERRLQLVTAAIAASAALVGAVVGGGASYLSTKQQITAEGEQARSEYLRTQRKETYTRLLRLGDACVDRLTQLSNFAGESGRPPKRLQDDVERVLRELEAVIPKVGEASLSVQLVGTPEIGEAATAFATACDQGLWGPEVSDSADEPTPRERVRTLDLRIQALALDLDAYVALARRDLGIDQ